MLKITNDGLTRSGMHRMIYSCTHIATVGVKGHVGKTVVNRLWRGCIISYNGYMYLPICKSYTWRATRKAKKAHL